MNASTPIGTVGSDRFALVGHSGAVSTGTGATVSWVVEAEDRAHVPAVEIGLRQRLIGNAPVVETAMRVPGGDVLQRAYAVRVDDVDVAVVEFDNASSASLVIHVVSSAPSRQPRIEFVREPVKVDRSDPHKVTYVVPLAHRAATRLLVPLAAARDRVSPRSVPAAAQVAKGWSAHRDSGSRLDIPAGRLADAVAANRCYQLLLGASARRARPASTFAELDALIASASPTWTWATEREPFDRAAVDRFLALAESAMVASSGRNSVALARLVDAGWAGQSFGASAVRVGAYEVSFAVRWHGERPALLWEVEGGRRVAVTAPGLDPAWSSTERRGEALLAPFAKWPVATEDS